MAAQGHGRALDERFSRTLSALVAEIGQWELPRSGSQRLEKVALPLPCSPLGRRVISSEGAYPPRLDLVVVLAHPPIFYSWLLSIAGE